MKTRALDSRQILQWMGGRPPAGDRVADGGGRRSGPAFDERHQRRRGLLLPAEVYSEALAESWREASRTLPVTIEVPTSDDIWSAATLKSRFPIAYADAFAAALAQKYNCPPVTGDPELRNVGRLEIDWIGRS